MRVRRCKYSLLLHTHTHARTHARLRRTWVERGGGGGDNLISGLKIFEARTNWIQMGGAYLVTWTLLCFQFYLHQSLQHFKASRYFQTVVELLLSVHDLSPSKPRPFAQIKIDNSEHARTEVLTGRLLLTTRKNKPFKGSSAPWSGIQYMPLFLICVWDSENSIGRSKPIQMFHTKMAFLIHLKIGTNQKP